MGPTTQILCDRLKEAIVLLNRVNATHWAEWMKVALSRIENADLSGVEHLLAAYGGMGSFNDLLVHPLNGHPGTESECRVINDKLEKLRTELYDLAAHIRHSAVVE